MKQKTIQLFCLAVALIMLSTMFPLAGVSATQYKTGDIVRFGTYPQSEVKDEALIAELNAIDENWLSYSYMSGDQTDWKDGSAQPSDYMKYKDVFLPNGDRYRAVTFSTYRPYSTNYKSSTSTENTNQNDNGYQINKVYWFKYEELDWIVLDPQLGLVLCKDIIDSQPYSDTIFSFNDGYYKDQFATIYANNYANSSIRDWLNNNYYYTAFTAQEKSKITTSAIANNAYSSAYSQYDSIKTNDKVFLLTYEDALKSEYGFSSDPDNGDINRRASGSDYAKCQGLYVDSSLTTADRKATSIWWLRSAGTYSFYASSVYYIGYASSCEYVYYSNIGVRPAMIIDLSAAEAKPTEPTTEAPTIPSTEDPSPETETEPPTEPSTQPATTATEPTVRSDEEKSQQDNSFFGKIKAFFQSIIDFFKDLFKR